MIQIIEFKHVTLLPPPPHTHLILPIPPPRHQDSAWIGGTYSVQIQESSTNCLQGGGGWVVLKVKIELFSNFHHSCFAIAMRYFSKLWSRVGRPQHYLMQGIRCGELVRTIQEMQKFSPFVPYVNQLFAWLELRSTHSTWHPSFMWVARSSQVGTWYLVHLLMVIPGCRECMLCFWSFNLGLDGDSNVYHCCIN